MHRRNRSFDHALQKPAIAFSGTAEGKLSLNLIKACLMLP
jgi:hypothetical protein